MALRMPVRDLLLPLDCKRAGGSRAWTRSWHGVIIAVRAEMRQTSHCSIG